MHSPSEFGVVTPSEDYGNGISFGGFGSTGIIPGVFALVTRWCVRGDKRICVRSVGVDDVWVVFSGVAVTYSAVVPNIFAHFC